MAGHGAPKGKRKYNAEKHCGAKTRSKGPGRTQGPCTRGKGERTDHPGEGRCWIHGGRVAAAVVTHGLYATCNSEVIRESIARVRATTKDIMDLTPEAELLRGLVLNFVERQQELQVKLNDWHLTAGPAMMTLIYGTDPVEQLKAIADLRSAATLRPAQNPINIDAASRLAGEVGKMIERIHKIKQTSAVTYESVNILLERMAMVVLKHEKDRGITDAITRDWGELEIPTTTGQRA